MTQSKKVKKHPTGKKNTPSITKKEKLLFAIGSILLLSLIGWLSVTIIIPQKQQLSREQNMSMWNSKGRQLLSRIGYCDEVSSSQKNTDITSYTTSSKEKNQSEKGNNVAQKSCEKAKIQLQDAQKWCNVDVPQQLKIEGNEVQNQRYVEQKDFVLNLCDALQNSNFGKEN